MRSYQLLFLALVVSGDSPRPSHAQESAPRFDRRWFYAPQNLLVDKSVDEVVTLIDRAARAGYNGVVLADYKFNILDRMPPNYFQNVARVRGAAKAAKVEIIPAIFPIGYSDGILAHDPNLAEGLPVVDAPFHVKGREATAVVDPSTMIANGDLEQHRGDAFVAFGFQDDPGKATVIDRTVVHQGSRSCRMQDVAKNSSTGNARLVQRVKVRPHACYRLSCWVKTKDLVFPGGFHLLALGAGPGNRQLTFHEGGLQPTQDWTFAEVVFNSLDEREVNIYAGLWAGKTGTLWLDDLKLEEVSLVNILRRDGCPLVVAAADGRATYEEGRDFEPVRDPQLGVIPYAGLFDFRHAGPTIRLTRGSRIRDGEDLRVSWYHPVSTHGSQMMCCLTDPKVYDVLHDQARRVNELFHAETFLMSHDEIRVANWCRACRARRMAPGALLADNTRRCLEILKAVSPRARVAVWSDMYDPFHNAVDHYYLVNGSLKESWKGLAANVLIVNWNGGKAKDTLKWFADRGHDQVLAGYYDVDDLTNLREWTAAARGVPRVVGFMYTTWEHKYGWLEKYGEAIRTHR
jgi:hypothetical protein